MTVQGKSTSVWAIIPARGGSKGLPKKNVRTLSGFPLIAFSIAAARACPMIERTFVTTDDPEIAEVARFYGAEAPFLRPKEFSEDHSPDREFLLHFLNWSQSNLGLIPMLLVHLRPTTPLRDPKVVTDAIRYFSSLTFESSLRSAHVSPESPFKWFRMSLDKTWRPLLEMDAIDSTNRIRQDFENVYIPNGYVDILRSEQILSAPSIHGHRIASFVTQEVIEIDTLFQFQILESMLLTHSHVILKHMERLF